MICSGAVRERVVFTSQTNSVDVRTFATVVVAESSLAADGPRFVIRYDGKPSTRGVTLRPPRSDIDWNVAVTTIRSASADGGIRRCSQLSLPSISHQ